MNLRGAWALVRGLWLSWLQYASFFFVLAFGWMVPPLIYLFVWSTAAGETTIGGLSRGAFVAYYLVLILVNQLTYAQTNWTVGDLIRSGGMNRILLRPMPAIFDAIASEMAGKVVYLIFDLPVVVALALWLKPELTWRVDAVLAFIPAVIGAWALRFLWGYALAVLAFWASRADALLALQDSLIFLLAGQVAPIALLPEPLATLAAVLPFRYMVAFPVEILTGQLDGGAIANGFVMQGVWLLGAAIVARVLWVRGIGRYAAIGG